MAIVNHCLRKETCIQDGKAEEEDGIIMEWGSRPRLFPRALERGNVILYV